MRPVLWQSKEQFVSSNLKISKKINVSSNNDIENSIMLLKRLPNITLHVVDPKPVFEVAEFPKQNPLKMNGSDNKSKTISKSKVFPKEQNYNIITGKNKSSKLFKNSKNFTEKNLKFQKSLQHKRKQIQKPFDNITSLIKNKNFDTIISKISEEIPKTYSYSEVKNTNTQKNTQKTSTPKKRLKISPSFPNIESKNLISIKPAKKQKKSNTSYISNTNYHDVKSITENNFVKINIEYKTHELPKDYLLVDLSSDSEIHIVPESLPLDFINVSLPMYDNFVMGISKSSGESSMHLETSQNYIEKQEFHFLNNRNYVDCSRSINKFIDIPLDLVTQSVSIKESASMELHKN